MIACLIGAAWICWKLLVLSLVIAPLSFYLISRLTKSAKRANRRAMEKMSSMFSILVETFSGIKVVKAFTMERYERRRFHEIGKQCLRHGMRIAMLDSLINPITEIMGIFIVCVAILAGAYLVLNQQTHLLGVRMSDRPLTMSGLLIFYGFLAGVSDPVRKVSEVYSRLQRAAAASDRVYQLLDRKPSMDEPAGSRQVPRHSRELMFDNISFGYRPDHPVLANVSLRIEFGETIAIVGANGCGKSTLANLVPRFFDPQEGRVLIDGVDVRDRALRDLRNQIGLVTQETLLFDDTVFNNIRYGAPDANRQDVIEAAKQAMLISSSSRSGTRLRYVCRRQEASSPAGSASGSAGPGHPARSGDPDPGRSYQSDRSGERATDPQSVGTIHAQPDHDHHHPPPGDTGSGRSDRGHARRPDYRHRLPTTNWSAAAIPTAGCTKSNSARVPRAGFKTASRPNTKSPLLAPPTVVARPAARRAVYPPSQSASAGATICLLAPFGTDIAFVRLMTGSYVFPTIGVRHGAATEKSTEAIGAGHTGRGLATVCGN